MTPTESKPKGRKPRKRRAYLNSAVKSPSMMRQGGRAWAASANSDGTLVFKPKYGRDNDVRKLTLGHALDAAICNGGVVVDESNIRSVLTVDGVLVTVDGQRPTIVTFRDLVGLIGPLKQPTIL